MLKVIANGTPDDYSAMESAEAQLKDGDNVELHIFVTSPVGETALKSMEEELKAQGIVLREPLTYDSGLIVVKYVQTTQSPTQFIGAIPLIVWGIITVVGMFGTGMFSWFMSKEITNIFTNPLFIAAGVGLIVIVLMMSRKQSA